MPTNTPWNSLLCGRSEASLLSQVNAAKGIFHGTHETFVLPQAGGVVNRSVNYRIPPVPNLP